MEFAFQQETQTETKRIIKHLATSIGKEGKEKGFWERKESMMWGIVLFQIG